MGFFIAGKVESLVIDKHTGVMTVGKTGCFCCTTSKAFDLKEVCNIRAFKKGHEGINFYTLHYALNAEFNTDEPPIKIWDSPHQETIDEKVSKVKLYQPCALV